MVKVIMKLRLVVVFCLAASFWFVSLGCGEVGSEENLLKNPGFEEVNSEGISYQWILIGKSPAVIDKTISHTGNNSLRLEIKKWKHGNYFQQPVLKVRKGEVYKLRVWYKMKDPDLRWTKAAIMSVWICPWKGEIVWKHNPGLRVAASLDWKEGTKEFKVEKDGYLKISSNLYNDYKGTIWFDDMILTRVYSPHTDEEFIEAGENFVENGDFEAGDGENIERWKGGKIERAFLDETVKHSGGKSLKLVNTESVSNTVFQMIPVSAVTPGKRYRLSYFAKGEKIVSPSNGVIVHLRDTDGKRVSIATQRWTGTFDWMYRERDFVIPDNIKSVELHCSLYREGTLWVDDVKLVPIKVKVKEETIAKNKRGVGNG